jgi:hypothetical protein
MLWHFAACTDRNAKVTIEEGRKEGRTIKVCPLLNFPPENASNLVSPKKSVETFPHFSEKWGNFALFLHQFAKQQLETRGNNFGNANLLGWLAFFNGREKDSSAQASCCQVPENTATCNST